MFPYVSAIDNFQLNFTFAPILNFILGIILIKCYPSVKQWSTARSDTTVILGATFGSLSAATMMNKLGLLDKPLTPPIYSIIPPNLGLCFVRTIVGMLIVVATRQLAKTAVLRVTCWYYGLDWKDPESKRSAKVEMPYYYLTYSTIGFNACFTCPLVYRMLGINRDYSYTELWPHVSADLRRCSLLFFRISFSIWMRWRTPAKNQTKWRRLFVCLSWDVLINKYPIEGCAQNTSHLLMNSTEGQRELSRMDSNQASWKLIILSSRSIDDNLFFCQRRNNGQQYAFWFYWRKK